MGVANRVKGLDLVDRMPEELWTEVSNIVQEAMTQTIPKKKKHKKGKVVVWGGCTNSWEKKWKAKEKGKDTLFLTHLEPDILECEIKWALGSITANKASRGDGIPAELFQILKDDAVEVLHSTCQQIWKTHQLPQDWKRCFHSNPKGGQYQRMFKLWYSCTHFTC